MKTIQVDPDIYTYLVSRATEIGESPSHILRRELHLPQPAIAFEIDDDIYAYLVSRTVTVGDSASQILRRELHLAPGTDPTPNPSPGSGPGSGQTPGIVEFHIATGTGGGAWNVREHPVVATVGDTLRIYNDDLVPHRPHTNGTPFPHADADIAPGSYADYVLQSAFEPPPAGTPPIYDHNYGPNAAFWIRVLAAH